MTRSEKQKEVITLYRNGESVSELARVFDLPKTTVHRWVGQEKINQKSLKYLADGIVKEDLEIEEEINSENEKYFALKLVGGMMLFLGLIFWFVFRQHK